MERDKRRGGHNNRGYRGKRSTGYGYGRGDKGRGGYYQDCTVCLLNRSFVMIHS